LKSNSWAFSICSASAGSGAAAAAVASSRGSCCAKSRRGRAELLLEEDATGFRSGAARRGEQEVGAAASIAVAMGAGPGRGGVGGWKSGGGLSVEMWWGEGREAGDRLSIRTGWVVVSQQTAATRCRCSLRYHECPPDILFCASSEKARVIFGPKTLKPAAVSQSLMESWAIVTDL